MSFVYFISNDNAVKIGITRNVQVRLYDLQTANHQRLYLINAIPCDSTSKARKLERLFHIALRKYQKMGEWFSIEALEDIDFKTETIAWGDGGLHFTAELDGKPSS